MAKKQQSSGVDEAAATAAEASKAIANASASVKRRANPLTNEAQTHVDQGRFCVKPKNDGEQEYFTDSAANAYTRAGEGYEVIDHHRGNSRYHGPVSTPAAAKSE